MGDDVLANNDISNTVKEENNVSEEVPKETESNGAVEDNVSDEHPKETESNGAVENNDVPKAVPPPNKTAKTVASILLRVKEDTEMSGEEKIDTLSMLLGKFVEENGVLIKEVEAKRQESMGGYSDTMGELSTLLETQSGQNNKLLTENTELSQHMGLLLEEAQKREKQFETIQTELTLQLKLMEAQLKKAQLEKSEVKCEMTQERMEISQELSQERDRSINLERTVSLLREQLDVYEKQSSELSQGVGNNAKQFQHFKAQIEKLTTNMTTLEDETSQWREKSELSAKQVQKMNQIAMEKDKEFEALKKKLDGMVKLNQALTTERTELMKKVESKGDN